MKILALEISSARGSLAWRDDEAEPSRGRWLREWPNDRKNSGAFFANLAELQASFGPAERIVVGLGPGSYAGTRIAISAAIGLSFGGTTSVSSSKVGRDRARPSIELVGMPSICAIDCDAPEYWVVGDARRQSFFFARVHDHDVVEGPDLLSEAELRAKIDDQTAPLFATEELPQFAHVERAYPSARVLARLATEANRRFVLPPLEPMYLREPHITQPKTR